jgi:hypothetical protein
MCLQAKYHVADQQAAPQASLALCCKTFLPLLLQGSVSARIDDLCSSSEARLAAFNSSLASGANSIEHLHLFADTRPDGAEIMAACRRFPGVTWLQPLYR